MKTLILSLTIFVTLAATALADSQRFVFFNPESQSIALYRESTSGFRRSFDVKVAELEAPQQATVAAALGWLQSQLAAGEILNLVIFEPYQIADDPDTAEVDETAIGLRAAVTGRRASGGERTISIDSKDVPDEVRAGLVGLWSDLAAVPMP